MLDELDYGAAVVYAIPMQHRFRGITTREGMLIPGPLGWAEFCPFAEYDDREAVAWLATAVEQACAEPPVRIRDSIPVNCTVPAVDPDRAHEIVATSGCTTAKVKVADHPDAVGEDLARIEAVRATLGPHGRVRVDANGRWDVDTAVANIIELDRAAGGLEYVEQPCRTIEELAAVRRKVDIPIAADESIRRADDPLRVAMAGAADIAVIKCTPLGGVRRSLQVAEAADLPCVVSSALETSIGLTAQLALAAALPELDHACGLGTLSLFEGDLVADTHSLRPVDGRLSVPHTPLDPDPELLERFRHPDPSRTRWWHNRLSRVRQLL